jgi:putative hydrolase of the HAD superfamily
MTATDTDTDTDAGGDEAASTAANGNADADADANANANANAEIEAGVEAVLFDLDDTLVAYDQDRTDLLATAFEAEGVEPFFTPAEYLDRADEFVGDDADGETGSFRERCFAALAREHGRDPALGRRLARAYVESRDFSAVSLLLGAREAVTALAADHALGMITNGPRAHQRQKLEAVDLHDAFETEVYAGYDTPAKPASEPFERALAELGVRPDQAVYVGNSHATDVAGARAAGVHAVWTPADADAEADADSDPAPVFACATLAELVPPPW